MNRTNKGVNGVATLYTLSQTTEVQQKTDTSRNLQRVPEENTPFITMKPQSLRFPGTGYVLKGASKSLESRTVLTLIGTVSSPC